MACDNDSGSRISYEADNRPSLVRGEPFARRQRPFYNGVLSAERPSEDPESCHYERYQDNNLSGWRTNLEVFASAGASSVAADSTTPRSHYVDFMQGVGQDIQVSGERRNATCGILLGQQFPAWQSSNHEDVEMMDAVEEPRGAGGRPSEAPGHTEGVPSQSREIERSIVSHRRRNAGEMTADEEAEDEPDSIERPRPAKAEPTAMKKVGMCGNSTQTACKKNCLRLSNV